MAKHLFTNECSIRRMIVADLSEVRRLQKQVLPVSYPWDWYEELVEEEEIVPWVKGDGDVRIGFVAERPRAVNEDNKVASTSLQENTSVLIGCATIRAESDGTANLMTIAVKPCVRRQQVGTRLLRHVLGFLEQATALHLEDTAEPPEENVNAEQSIFAGQVPELVNTDRSLQTGSLPNTCQENRIPSVPASDTTIMTSNSYEPVETPVVRHEDGAGTATPPSPRHVTRAAPHFSGDEGGRQSLVADSQPGSTSNGADSLVPESFLRSSMEAGGSTLGATTTVPVPPCHVLMLQVHERNEGAIAFYKAHGFRVVGILRDYFCSGPASQYGDGVLMGIALSARGQAMLLDKGRVGQSRSSGGACVQSKAQKRNARRARKRTTQCSGKKSSIST